MKSIRPIKFVAQQTGLSAHTIRVWERRYQAVRPTRTKDNRRLYSEADVERLRLLHAATGAGHTISQIARAPLAELRDLAQESAATFRRARKQKQTTAVDELMENAIAALLKFDAKRFFETLERAAIELGTTAMLQKFVAPLAQRIGDLWRDGELAVAHEHFASNHLTAFLNDFARPFADNERAPLLALATPTGQLHELGAILAAAAARSHGWRTMYFGASLPVEELLGIVENLEPRALGLSIVFPPSDAALRSDLKKLGRLLPKEIALLVGGRSAGRYLKILRAIKAIHVGKIERLFPVLDKLQHARAKPVRGKIIPAARRRLSAGVSRA